MRTVFINNDGTCSEKKSSRSGPLGPFLSHHRTYRSVYGGSIKYKIETQLSKFVYVASVIGHPACMNIVPCPLDVD